MSAHMIWIVLMAIATVTILTVGTLAAAGMLTRTRPAPGSDVPEGRPAERPDDRPAGRR